MPERDETMVEKLDGSVDLASSQTAQDQVQTISNKLEKLVIEENAGSSDVADLLRALETLPIDLKILQNTNVGKTVNTLRKESKNEEVAILCKNLVKSWKGLLKVSTAGGNSPSDGGQSPNTAPSSTPARRDGKSSNGAQLSQAEPQLKRLKASEGQSASPADANKEPSASQKALSRSSSSNSLGKDPTSPAPGATVPQNASVGSKGPVSTNLPPGLSGKGSVDSHTTDAFRLKSRELMVKALTKDGLPEGICRDPSDVATELETCIFTEFKSTDTRYKNRVRSRIINLQDSRNPRLRENVMLGVISCRRFATMSSEDMASDEMKNLREKYQKEALNDNQMSVTGGTESDLLQCGKCKQRKCSYNQVQTRSADEPMTTFVYCNTCGNRWKFC